MTRASWDETARRVYWIETEPPADPGPALEGTLDVDVAVVGAGYTGLSTALHLRTLEPSLDVAVLETETTGYGASGRNAGFAMTAFGASLSLTSTLHGLERTRAAYRHMVEAVDYLGALIDRHRLDCAFERTGFLRAATTPAYVRRIQAELRLAERIGLTGVEWLDRRRLADRVESPVFLGGWWEPRCALLHPVRLARELRRAALRSGARLYDRTPVLSIERGRGYLLTTPGGRVRARRIALATNAYSHLVPGIERRQCPAFTYLVATEPLRAEHLDPIGWRGREGIEDARNLLHYFRLSPDGRLLMGGGPVGIAFGRSMAHDAHDRAFRHLEEHIRRVFPSLAGVGITHRWGGAFSVTLDLAPSLGYVHAPDAVYSVGCIGHGVALTPYNGLVLAELLLEHRTERTERWFVRRRGFDWPPEPLRIAAAAAVRSALAIEDTWWERNGLGNGKPPGQA